MAWLRYGSGHVHAISLNRQPLFDFKCDALRRETARHYGIQLQTRQYDVMGNLLERYAGTHYQYDERGNRRRQTEPSGRTTEYIYDADDQLREVKRYRRAPAAGDTTPPEMHAKYGYDGFGRRLWKLVKDGKATPKLTVFSWDANLLTSEEVFEGEFHFWDTFAYPKEPELTPEDPSKRFSLPIAQRVHTLTARTLKCTHWLYEPDSFVPAAQLVDTYNQHAQRMTGTESVAYSSHESADLVTTEPQLYYIHTDHLGTPQELTDRDGQLHWTGHYRAWGELAKANNSEGNTANVEMPLRFQGQYCDAETGFHYNRFRYYDPQIGRFTTQDPISLAGGINLYQYAPNPVQWVDLLGLNRKPNDCPKNKKTTYYGDSRRDSLRQAKRDAGVPVTQHPEQVSRVPLEDGYGARVKNDDGSIVEVRQYHYESIDGRKIMIQEHSLGHEKATAGHGAEPHFNIRPISNPSTGSVEGTHGHYNF